nr:hypothetical protein [Calditrichia bacterium]
MNPLYSMTGFATARVNHPAGEITCEIRSVNSRYLEMFVKTPPNLREFEDAVKDTIRNKLNRGKINCAIAFTAAPEV